MKKLHILIALIPLFFSLKIAYAKDVDQFYVGVDGIRSLTSHEMRNSNNAGSRGVKRHGEKFSFGLNTGYRMNYDRMFVAPEIFYEELKNSAHDFGSAASSTMEVSNRYGGKVNLGYRFTSDVSGFVNIGLANVRHINRDPSEGLSHGSYKLAPVYGVGALYDLHNNWAVKVAYDYQRFSYSYYSDLPGRKDDVSLQVFKVGAVYSF